MKLISGVCLILSFCISIGHFEMNPGNDDLIEFCHGSPSIIINDFSGNEIIVAISGKHYNIEIMDRNGNGVVFRNSDQKGYKMIDDLLTRTYKAKIRIEKTIREEAGIRVLGCRITRYSQSSNNIHIQQINDYEDGLYILNNLNIAISRLKEDIGVKYVTMPH